MSMHLTVDEMEDTESCIAGLRRINKERLEAYDSWRPVDLRSGPIPEHIIPGIARYISHGIRPGSFLEAMLTNDLRGVMQSADDENLKALPAIWNFLYNTVPSSCWGSPEKMTKWMEQQSGNPF